MHDDERPHRKTAKCLRCGFAITWADRRRRQYGRAIRHGLTPEEAKPPYAAMP